MSSKTISVPLSIQPQQKKAAAVFELLQAAQYAEDLGGDRWVFAIEIRRLQKLGLNNTDLRWLVRKGLITQAKEVTLEGHGEREFVMNTSLKFCKRTCFILSEAGISYARSLTANVVEPSLITGVSSLNINPSKLSNGRMPFWDPITRELRLGDVIIKRFKWKGINQETVLSAFQEDGWPTVIDDPLPPKEEQDSRQRLHDTIKALNRRQEYPCIRFHGNGTGEGIRWEFVDPEA